MNRFIRRNPRAKRQFLLMLPVVILAMGYAVTAQAVPYRPTDPNQIIEQLPRGFPVVQADASAPRDLSIELDLEQIQNLLNYAYLQGDPRALGQAIALLQRQSARTNDVPHLLLLAQAAQANHQFAEATSLLNTIKQQQPNNSDVYLQLASIELVGGNFAAARQHCEQIRGLDALALRLLCLAQVDAMTGKLQATADKLHSLAPLLSTLNASQQLWAQLIQADLALRLNDKTINTRVFAQLPTENIPALMARADWLLAQKQWQAVDDLLKNHTEHEGLLIRWVTSKQRLKQADAQKYQQLLAERISQWRQRNDQAHHREQASYALLAESASQSLRLARENWQTQRETADFVIYATAALRSQSQVDIQVLLDWARSTGFEYPIVLQRLQAARLTASRTQDVVK
ncbi:MAG: tetratricopeptide repeat protein [Moraxellaceae bacterium]